MSTTSTYTNFTTILIIFQWNVFKFIYDPLKTLGITMYKISTTLFFVYLIFPLILRVLFFIKYLTRLPIPFQGHGRSLRDKRHCCYTQNAFNCL